MPDDRVVVAAQGATGLGRSALWNVAASVVSGAAGLLVIGLAFRHVHEAQLGFFLTAMAAQSLLVLLDPVVGFSIARATAVAPGREPAVTLLQGSLDALGLAALVGTALGAFALGVWVAASHPPASMVVGLLILLVSFAAQLSTAELPGAANGLGDFRATGLASVVGAAANVTTVLLTIGSWGVAGIAAGVLVGVLSSRLVLLGWRAARAPWVPVIPHSCTKYVLVNAWRESRWLLLLTVAGQVIAWTDLVIVGAFRGTAMSAEYRLGVIVPTQVTALLFRAYDVVFPLLARGSVTEQERITRLLTRIFAAGSGVVLGVLIALRTDVLWLLGADDERRVATTVFVIFCFVWAANVPVHGLALLLIAKNRQSVFAPLLAAEAALNIVLTLLLTPLYGPIGAATATLVTLVVSNLVVLPMLARAEIA
ncbi:MAG: polysaccharide biosynthesis C-terminal domain-containing protein, partial [Actinomycetota bacterium]|nr:polysaccharide biosynthesis C-terminal domain-containing protein [Actinomycetota bacterium]